MKINEQWLQGYLNTKINMIVETIKLIDGNTISVQASSTHYCSPRKDFAIFDSVEIGFPTLWDEELFGDKNDDVAGYIPIENVITYINNHGGVKITE
jgi:hypothetical protein